MLLHRTITSPSILSTALAHQFIKGSGITRRFAAQLPPRIVINEDDIQESFLKGSGPGGQKIVCDWSIRVCDGNLADPSIASRIKLPLPYS